MSLEKIIAKILDDARAEAERIAAEGGLRAEAIRDEARREAERQAEILVREAEREARLEAVRIVTQARLEQLFLRERYRELDRLTVNAILDEATKFAADVLAPLNAAADVEGSHYDQATSRVTLAKGFREAYNLFCENGWMGFSANPAYGGQGMPYVLHLAVNDILFGSCLSFCLNPYHH